MLAHASISPCNIHCKLVSDKTFTPSLNPPSFTSSSFASSSPFPFPLLFLLYYYFLYIYIYISRELGMPTSFLPPIFPWNHLQNYTRYTVRIYETCINFVYKKRRQPFSPPSPFPLLAPLIYIPRSRGGGCNTSRLCQLVSPPSSLLPPCARETANSPRSGVPFSFVNRTGRSGTESNCGTGRDRVRV